MKIGIIGTRGIPNNYGGFEQFAESFSVYMVNAGHDITVYCSSLHQYTSDSYKGVCLIRKFDPENRLGSFGQFVYDALCIIDSRSRNFDLILQLGYTSSSIFSFLFTRKVKIVTNMDGLEWKRSKYTLMVQKYLLYAESLAVKKSNFLISDSIGIQSYLKSKYNVDSIYIPYGATENDEFDSSILGQYSLLPNKYNLLIARMEPENNIEMIIKATIANHENDKLIVIGNYSNKFGQYLFDKYASNQVVFLGGIYNQVIISNLRYFSNLYFHGHSVGGTNPSLIEAMANSCLIVAHKNIFNESILNESAFYFNSENDICELLSRKISKLEFQTFIESNLNKIRTTFSLEEINKKTEEFLINCM